jgi:FtsZ-interacting cell division protein YlmF
MSKKNPTKKESEGQLEVFGNLKDLENYYPMFIKSEINLSTLPLFGLSKKDRSKKNYEIRMKSKNGLESILRISVNTDYGFPTPLDYKVFKAIEYIISQLKLPIQNPIKFSVYQICKILGMKSLSNANYLHIKESIERMSQTGIKIKNAFYVKDKKNWIDTIFNIYDRVVFKGETLPNGEIADTCYLWLNDSYLQSLNTFYVKPLDFRYFSDLNSDIARRLYDIISPKFYGLEKNKGDCVKFYYKNLCQLLPITPQKKLYIAKGVLKPAHDELLETKFFSQVIWNTDKGKWVISYYPGERVEYERNAYKNHKYLSPTPSREAGDQGRKGDGEKQETRNKKQETSNQLSVIGENNEKLNFAIEFERRGLKNANEILKRAPRTLEELEIILKDFDKRKNTIENKAGWLNRVLTMKVYTRPNGILTKSEEREKRRKGEKEKEEKKKQEEENKKEQERFRDENNKKELANRKAKYQDVAKHNKLWNKIKKELSTMIEKPPFTTWIEPIFICKINDKSVIINVPNRFFSEWLIEHYLDKIKSAVKKVLSKDYEIEFEYEYNSKTENRGQRAEVR